LNPRDKKVSLLLREPHAEDEIKNEALMCVIAERSLELSYNQTPEAPLPEFFPGGE